MSLPDQTAQSPGDAFHSGLGGDPSFYAQDHTELQLSYQSNQGPVARSNRMAEGWRHKIESCRDEKKFAERLTAVPECERLQMMAWYFYMRRCSALWQTVLSSKIEATFLRYRKTTNDNSDHKTKCQQLAIARRAAGYSVHPDWRDFANSYHDRNDRT